MNISWIIKTIKKQPENVLEHALDLLQLGTDEYVIIDSELDLRADRLTATQKAKLEAKKQLEIDIARRAQIIDSLTKEHGERCFSKAAAVVLGEDFVDDYTVESSLTEFVVHSFAESVNETNKNQWFFETKKEAEQKIIQLIYYRVYDHFARRDGWSDDHIALIQEEIIRMKSGNGND